jgi:hypothetical protein
MNGRYKLPVYAAYDNSLGKNINTAKNDNF